jgi:hypothetical protein
MITNDITPIRFVLKFDPPQSAWFIKEIKTQIFYTSLPQINNINKALKLLKPNNI